MRPIRDPGGEWYERAFGRLYPLLYAHRDDTSATREARALVGVLGLAESKPRVLDVCCGGGRHAAAFARLGFDVWAADLSPWLLEEALLRQEIFGRLTRADMRALPFSPGFDLVINLFTSFGYFSADRENEKALAEMARVLKEGGCLVVDHINRHALEKSLVKEDTRRIRGCEIHQRRRIEENRIVKEITVVTDREDPIHLTESVRLYYPEELDTLLRGRGLHRIRLYGSFSGEPLEKDSPRMIAVAQKKRG